MSSAVKIWVSCCICLFSLSIDGRAVEPVDLKLAESSLRSLFSQMKSSRNDDEKTRLADSIVNILDHTLKLPGSFDYPFDSLIALGKIISPDLKLRIYTWNLPNSSGSNRYYGFIQYRSDNNAVLVFRLTDKSNDLTDPLACSLTADQWYGALIYEIIDRKYEGTTYYTLLGYDPHNLFLSRKITDVLYFTGNNEPLFGSPIFHYQDRKQCRIFFEYSAKVQMSLRWNRDLKMIVFDHLSPSNPMYTGNYQYYGPDFSYDGFRFENGSWEMVEDVNVRNSRE